MKALILAAGIGSRLAPLTDEYPKSLIKINGKPIIFQQIDNLHDNNIFDITIISGYRAEILETTILENYPDIQFIRNEAYVDTNNMYSAYLSVRDMDNSDFLMMNADVFFDSSIIRTLLNYDAENAIVTDIGHYFEESMKVVEKDGRIINISKSIPQSEALGNSIDVYKFSSLAGKRFFEKCNKYINANKQLRLWSEVALNDILYDIEFKACPLNGRWYEIDNLEDFAKAEILFKEECDELQEEF